MRVAAALQLSVLTILTSPTVAGMALALATDLSPLASPTPLPASPEGSHGIAVVGMAVRVAQAGHLDRMWDLLANGVDAATDHSAAEMRAAGATTEMITNPHWVACSGMLAAHFVESFDTALFGMSKSEAMATDPAQRLALECSYEVRVRDRAMAGCGGCMCRGRSVFPMYHARVACGANCPCCAPFRPEPEHLQPRPLDCRVRGCCLCRTVFSLGWLFFMLHSLVLCSPNLVAWCFVLCHGAIIGVAC